MGGCREQSGLVIFLNDNVGGSISENGETSPRNLLVGLGKKPPGGGFEGVWGKRPADSPKDVRRTSLAGRIRNSGNLGNSSRMNSALENESPHRKLTLDQVEGKLKKSLLRRLPVSRKKPAARMQCERPRTRNAERVGDRRPRTRKETPS